jgi:hypothetical protein
VNNRPNNRLNSKTRRQLVIANVIDASVARAAVNESRRQRAEAAERLAKEMAAKRFAARSVDTVSYPLQEAG